MERGTSVERGVFWAFKLHLVSQALESTRQQGQGFLRVNDRDRDRVGDFSALEDPFQPGECYQDLSINCGELSGQERGVQNGAFPGSSPLSVWYSSESPWETRQRASRASCWARRIQKRWAAPGSIFEAPPGAAGCIPAEPVSSWRTWSPGAATIVSGEVSRPGRQSVVCGLRSRLVHGAVRQGREP